MLNRLVPAIVLLMAVASHLEIARANPPNQALLPKIVLIGDSIREGYVPFVVKLLEGKATVISNAGFGQNSTELLTHLDLVIEQQPDVIHFNCGLRDLARRKQSGEPTASLEQYEANLKQVVDRLKKDTRATLVFATTTPIVDERHAARKFDLSRTEADVRRYNEVAVRVMNSRGVEINDLHEVVTREGAEQLIANDGAHYDSKGSQKLAEAVNHCLLKYLAAEGKVPSHVGSVSAD